MKLWVFERSPGSSVGEASIISRPIKNLPRGGENGGTLDFNKSGKNAIDLS